MRKWIVPLAALALLLLAGAAQASYPCGIYARIDKVEFEPNADKPERVKVWGDFILVKTTDTRYGPRRGYMYFEIVKGKEDTCRIEWKDLETIAGSTKYVAFGSAYSERNDNLGPNGASPNVHTKDDRDVKPIPYPLNAGMYRLRTKEDVDFEQAKNPVAVLQKFLKENPADKP
jgi:hypothetical protein